MEEQATQRPAKMPDWNTEGGNSWTRTEAGDIQYLDEVARRAQWNSLTDDQKWQLSEQFYYECRRRWETIKEQKGIVDMIPRYSPTGHYIDPRSWINAAIFIIDRMLPIKLER